MKSLEIGKLRGNSNSKRCRSCNQWLSVARSCYLLRQVGPICIMMCILVTFAIPGLSLQDDLDYDNLAKMYSSGDDPDSDEYSGEPAVDKKYIEEYSQSLTSPRIPDVLNSETPTPPALKYTTPFTRTRLPGVRGRDNILSHQQKSTHDNTIIHNTPIGKIRGKTYYVSKTAEWVGGFLGVPYAEPPIEQLRFRPPVQKPLLTKHVDEVFNATDFGPICIQPADQKIWDAVQLRNEHKHKMEMKKRKLSKYNISEDCLTLNIYVGLIKDGTKAQIRTPTGSGFPVFFFIHGGSYYMNAGRLYPGQILASTQRLVVVTFNYRLGPLGFLSTEDKEATGNFGLLDQAMALDWVYRNINHFGGDPNKITLVGNSAGAASVMYHMFTGLSKGKFVGITVQSGCSGAPWAIQPSPKRHAEDLAKNLGCSTVSTSTMLECMRNRSAETIMQKAKLEDGLSLAYATVIDGKYGGKFLMDHPEVLIRSRLFHPVPVLAGFTKDEVTIWFTKFGPKTKMKDLRSFVQVDVVSLMDGLDTVTQASMRAMIHSVTVQYLYRAGSKENDTFGKTGSISDFISDVGLKAPCIKEMNLLEKFNSKPVYLYEFVYFSLDDIKMNKQDWIGAYHESELQFIFGEAYLNYTNHLRSFNDKRISDLMMSIWGNFARYGNPNADPNDTQVNKLSFTWSNYTEHNQDFAVLGLKSYMKKYFLTERMLFWNFFFPIFRDYPFQYNPTVSCEEWEVISKSWFVWTLLLVTLTSGFVVSFLIMLHVKRKLFSRLRSTNNNTSGTGGEVGVVATTQTTTGSSIATPTVATVNHNHHLHHRNISNLSSDHDSRDSSSINHNNRHSCSSSNTSGSLLKGQKETGGGSSSSGSSNSHLLHATGTNGTRVLSSSTSNSGGGYSVPANSK